VRTRRLPLAAAVAAGLCAAGCGGGSSANPATGQVKHVVRAALAALAQADGRRFCALTTPAARAQLGDILHGQDCVALIDGLGRHLSQPHRQALLHARVRRVTIHGRVATVASGDITSPGGKLRGWLNDGGTPTRLVRQPSGRWLIEPVS
jgi:hypothetical protein